jgi:hypothetical protein
LEITGAEKKGYELPGSENQKTKVCKEEEDEEEEEEEEI